MAKNTITLEKLLEVGAHFGHRASRWNPKMGKYIHGTAEGVHLFDLAQTKEKLEEALAIIKKASKEGKNILLVGTKKQIKDKVVATAQKAGIFYVAQRWLGGILTNWDQMRKSTQKLTDTKKKLETGEFNYMTKRERLEIEREVARLEGMFGGLVGLEKTPDLLIVMDSKVDHGAIKEGKMKEIEVIAITDTNTDPTEATYPIPMNDDATMALEYVLDLFEKAILEGKGKVKKTPVKAKKKK